MTERPSAGAGRSGGGERLTRWLVSLPPTLFLLLFFLAPALLMLAASFRQPGDFGGLAPLLVDGRLNLSLETYRFFFGDWIYAEIFLRSFLVAAATTLICLLLAYPLALLIARSERRRRDVLVLLVILPFASNFLIRVYAWIIVLGPFDLLYTPLAVIAGMVYVHLPFMILPLYTNLEKHDPALLEAAQDLGAGGWTRFRRITLPLSMPGIWSVGIGAGLHPGPRHVRHSRAARRHARHPGRQPDQGTVSRQSRLASGFHPVDAAHRCRPRPGGDRRPRRPATPRDCLMRRAGSPLWLWLAASAVYAFLYLPLAIVVIFSFNDSLLNAEWVGFTTRWYGVLLADEEMLRAAGNSLFIAVVASLIATVLGTMAGIAMQRWPVGLLRALPFLVLTPVAMPEILLGVSLLLFFRQVLDLTLGLVSILIAHITFSIGFVAIIVRARLAGMDESIFEAARDLGASPWQTFRRVTLPLILPGVIAGFLMSFTLSIDDFVITFFVAGVGVTTLPLQIYSMIKVAVTPEVNAVSTLLMALTLSLIALAARLAPDGIQGRR